MYSTEQLVDREIPVKDQDTQLAVISANPLDLPATTFQEGLDRRKPNRAALMAWIRDALVDGSDLEESMLPAVQNAKPVKTVKTRTISANQAYSNQALKKYAGC